MDSASGKGTTAMENQMQMLENMVVDPECNNINEQLRLKARSSLLNCA